MSRNTKQVGHCLRQYIAIVLVFTFAFDPATRAFAQEIEFAPVLPEAAQEPTPLPAATEAMPPLDEITEPSLQEPSQGTAVPPISSESTDNGTFEDEPTMPPGEEGLDSMSSVPEDDPTSGQNFIKQKLPDINTVDGSLTYEYPIAVPPGRNNLPPDLSLVYHSHPSEEDTVLGHGWTTNLAYIERINRKGSEKLYTEAYFYSSMSGELVSVGTTTWAAKIENGDFLTYSLSSSTWTVKDKKGTTRKFGTNAAERQDDQSDSAKVYRWMLQEHGTRTTISSNMSTTRTAGRFIRRRSNTRATTLRTRETRTDVIRSYKTGFHATTSYRLSEILDESQRKLTPPDPGARPGTGDGYRAVRRKEGKVLKISPRKGGKVLKNLTPEGERF